MKPLTLKAVAEAAGGTLVTGDPSATVGHVSTDTRTIAPGALFVALVGERFDAHGFMAEAVGGGAVGLLVSRPPDGPGFEGTGVVVVDDTLRGLQDLATSYRAAHPARGVAITGSSGKTSTKDMVAAVLAERFRVRATTGNLNNHIGVPLTLLAMEEDDEVGVWEMGMNHPGEIARLVEIARPEVGLVTNVGTAHIEFMGSREAIAEEKGSVVAGLPATGAAVLNADDPFTTQISARTRARVITAGCNGGDVRASGLNPHPNGTRFTLEAGPDRAHVDLPVPGRHMVGNAALAAAVGLHFGIDLETAARGLAKVRLTGGRLEHKVVRGVTVLDDTYNANPDSMRAALETLRSIPVDGRRFAVLGRMAELGTRAIEEHRALGAEAMAGGAIDELIAVGEGDAAEIAAGAATNSGGTVVVHVFPTAAACASYLAATAAPGDAILVKGSRSSRTEDVIEAFRESP